MVHRDFSNVAYSYVFHPNQEVLNSYTYTTLKKEKKKAVNGKTQ